MEKSKQIIADNSSQIKSVINTINSLLSEIVILNEKNLIALENDDKEIQEKAKHHARVNKTQCAILCILNKTVIDIETLLLSGCECETHCDKDVKIPKTNIPDKIIVQSAESNTKNDCNPIEGCAKEIDEEELIEDIVDSLNTYEEQEIDKVNDIEKQNVHFRISGKRTLSKSNTKKKKMGNGIYFEIFEKSLPQLNSFCMICHMESPSEFYIHVVDDDAAHLDEVSNAISEFYSNKKSEYKNKKDMMNDGFEEYCVAFIEKYQQWYRAEVLDWSIESEEKDVKIQLIDYGDYHQVPFYNLRPMFQKVSRYPRLAQRCHLQNICPLGQENRKLDEYEWSASDIETFMDILGPYTELQYEIVFVTNFASSIGIDLIREGDHCSISEHLYRVGLAAITLIDDDDKQENTKNNFIMEQILGSQGVLALPTMSENEKLTRFFKTALPLERTDDINEAVANYSPTDEKRICKFQEKCRKKNCKFEHVRLTNGFTTDRLSMFTCALYDLPLPQGGDVIKFTITHIKTVCNFYIHIDPSDDNIVYAQFRQLDETMNHPGTIKTYKLLKLLPAIGEIVIVNWENRWYRAKVQEVKSHDVIENVDLKVFIVDYGEVVDVKFSDLRQIEQDLLQVPFQAVECRLFNATVNVNADGEEAKEYLQFYISSCYTGQVVSVSMGYLELLVTFENGEDLGEKLISEGFAVAKCSNYVPAESETFLVD